MTDIVSVKKLLNFNLKIPEYQRPYKWTIKNIIDLLEDIRAVVNKDTSGSNYKYRFGTIIIHEKNGEKNIVDGQQRIISLLLLNMVIDENFSSPLINNGKFKNPISKYNIYNNYNYIKDYFKTIESEKERIIDAMDRLLEVVVITVKNQSEAFQLFDSQNSRGRPLDPHDLLKAYHLREMKEYPYEMIRVVNNWESVEPYEIKKLFSELLFPIYNWVNRNKSVNFSADKIDVYKGITVNSPYNYARRASKAMPHFQLAEPFIAGNDFFEMVTHYLGVYKNIITEISSNSEFREINSILNGNSAGMKYAKQLFYATLLCYYDRFRNFDKRAVYKIFLWSLMIRVDMEHLGFGSINNYAIGIENRHYTNQLPMFYEIKKARIHSEIGNIQIKIRDNSKSGKWDNLLMDLKKLSM